MGSVKRLAVFAVLAAVVVVLALASSAEAWTRLHEAAQRGTAEQMQRLIDGGNVDPNARSFEKGGVTPLHVAAANGKADVVKVLLDNWVDVDARDVGGNTPLHWAVRSEVPGVVEVLLAGGADANARDEYGYTPLHLAEAYSNVPGVVEVLLAGGADVNARDEYGRTPCGVATNGILARLGAC